MPTYTLLTGIAIAAAVAYELLVARTGLLRRSSFWISMGIMWFFQIFVDGWFTKLSSPIVIYDDAETLGIRLFFDSPVEDFGFGFAMILLTLVIWCQMGRMLTRRSPEDHVHADTFRQEDTR